MSAAHVVEIYKVEAAGIEPARSINPNPLMVRDFGCYSLRTSELPRRYFSPRVPSSPLESSPVLETSWRRPRCFEACSRWTECHQSFFGLRATYQLAPALAVAPCRNMVRRIVQTTARTIVSPPSMPGPCIATMRNTIDTSRDDENGGLEQSEVVEQQCRDTEASGNRQGKTNADAS